MKKLLLASFGLAFVACFGAAFERQNDTTNGTNINPLTSNADSVIGRWYYIANITTDGEEKELSNRVSYLWLKEDGSFENRMASSQIGTYSVSGNRLTLLREDGDKKVYTITFGNDGKKTHGLNGRTLTLRNASGGYKLEMEE